MLFLVRFDAPKPADPMVFERDLCCFAVRRVDYDSVDRNRPRVGSTGKLMSCLLDDRRGGCEVSSRSPRGVWSSGSALGLPVSVKDLFDVRGLPTTCGSPFYAGTRPLPGADCPYVADWRALGTVLVGKTNLNEFAYGITGENRWFGDVTQPGHPDRLTGDPVPERQPVCS